MSLSITAVSPVANELTCIFRRVLADPALELTPRTTADDLIGWDSLTHVNLIVEIEYCFNIQFQPAEIEALDNVSALLMAIEAKRAVAA